MLQLNNNQITILKKERRKKLRITEEANSTINQLDIIDIYRTFHLTTAEYTFFSSAHGTSTKTDHILVGKTNLNKCKSTKIIQSMFFDPNGIKLEINELKTLESHINTLPNN